ncbi:MAG: LacI family transcriptional regulator [Ruminococcaceae bacterium]|nr:LacI family transcriptional regulator [Oscillospiraceae bacterium]
MPVTLKDIAEELNISTNAVSRALRNMPDIGLETTKLVHETAQKLGYRKNLAASYLKTARSMTLGIIVPDVCNPVFSYMYKGIEKVCSKMGYTLMLSNSSESAEKELSRIDSMIAHGVDGVFIVPGVQSSKYYEQLDAAHVPYVILQRKSNSKPANFVQSDDYEGGYLAAKHLYELGHRRFLLVLASVYVSSAQDRRNGFVAYLKEQDLSESAIQIIECDASRDSGYEVTREWLEQQPDHKHLDATAIFCFSDYVTCGVYTALAEYGLSVPDDISVVGYDNNEYSGMISPALTTVDLLPYDIGKHAARLMLDILQSEQTQADDNPTKVIISPKLVVRSSTKHI